jgi:cellulose biosynthesis protein BcsQ
MVGLTLEELVKGLIVDLNQTDSLPQTNPSSKIVAFYAEKGGVGKTTLCLTLAQTLADTGKRVLVYDCDVQRSLTAWIFGNNIEINHSKQVNPLDNLIRNLNFNKDHFEPSLYEQVVSVTENVKPAHAVKIKKNLYLVCGDRDTPNLDEKIANQETMSSDEFSGIISIPNQLSGRPYHAIMKTAEYYKVDYVFLDMNPYPGVLNRCLLMSSHYIIIPTLLDFFCESMMNMMIKNLENWEKTTKRIIPSTKRVGGRIHWPNHKPKFLGYITSIFILPNSMPTPSVFSSRDTWTSEA